ncbi:hypothetical protein TARUN_79 [Trichoderma arundinaceum]|uniref:Uncharacterized protein n=1 Tax=Trichoderma arundinaceum TaxID=490622 RepID=A0A395P2M3_TRIAR|nr:hypothetical protein TARUN_79 [Trichoderma arundinaceum]
MRHFGIDVRIMGDGGLRKQQQQQRLSCVCAVYRLRRGRGKGAFKWHFIKEDALIEPTSLHAGKPCEWRRNAGSVQSPRSSSSGMHVRTLRYVARVRLATQLWLLGPAIRQAKSIQLSRFSHGDAAAAESCAKPQSHPLWPRGIYAGETSGSSDGTFYFQAWHIHRVVSGESWVQNKGIADFVEQNLSPDAKKWLFVKACVPTKERPGLLVPVSICVKLRAAKIGQDPMDAKRALLQFRNKEFPSIARSYFLTRLRKSLDFFNAFSEGAESDSSLADFNVVKSSKQLKERVQTAIKNVKKELWGDLLHGLAGGASPGSEFKAARFIARRGQGMYKDIGESDLINICLDFSDPASNPNLLPTTPLQNPLPLPDNSSVAVREPEPTLRPRKASDASDHTVGSTDGSGSDASSTCSVETTQSSVVADESSSSELHDAKEPSSDESSITLPAEEEDVSTAAPAAEETTSTTTATTATTAATSACTAAADVETSAVETPADSSEASYYQGTTAEAADIVSTTTAIIPSSGIVASRRKMNCVVSQDTQTAYFVVQNSGNWLQYLMANRAKSAQQMRSTFFDSPIILAAAVSPLQALKPDGMMRVYFMSQARQQQDEVVRDQKGRVIRTRRGSKSVREWVVGSAKVSTRALTKHLGKQFANRNARLLPAASPAVRKVDSVVGPNNRLIEMTAAPGIPQAVLISTPDPVEEVREGDIVQEVRDDGFVHIETKIVNRAVEEVVTDEAEGSDKKDKEEGRAKKPRSKGKAPYVKKKSKTDTKTHSKANIKKTAKVDQKTDTNAGARADVKTDIKVDAESVPPRKPKKVYTPPFSRKSWRDVEPQEPQVIYDVMSGYDFVQVEDFQVFSFSTTSHDMMLRTTPAAAAAVEEGEGLGVWAPPVVGIFSWMWDHLAPGGWSSKAAAAR